MKRVNCCLLAALLIMSLSISAYADMRLARSMPRLTISGTTAYCSGEYRGTDNKADVALTLILKQGTTIIETWTATGKGSANISETERVALGKTYTLTLAVTVDGQKLSEQSVTATS